MHRLSPVLAAVVVLASACSGSASDGAVESTTAPTTVDSAATTSTVTTSTVTTSSADTPTTAASTATDGDTNQLAERSGCTPGEGPLPDGEWFGFITAADPATATVDFDLACWFTGEAANAASDEDGGEVPVPNDYFIRNASDQVRTLGVATDATIRYLVDTGDGTTLTEVDLAVWAAARDESSDRPGVWLTVVDGDVVTIDEQYVP